MNCRRYGRKPTLALWVLVAIADLAFLTVAAGAMVSIAIVALLAVLAGGVVAARQLGKRSATPEPIARKRA
jgi:putative Ca2+/H+ antiporter (TMEM165/GDT1 family)